jgi:hypothetical protein
MSYRSQKSAFALLAVLFVASACGSKPPPKAEEAETATNTETPPAPPPPKKCESLEEKCKADKDTTAKVKTGGIHFKPTEGWSYAQGADNTLAQASDDGAVFIVSTYEHDAKDAKKDAANRDAAFDELVKAASVTPPKAKIAWKKPQVQDAVGDIKLDFWAGIDSERNKKKGQLLVVHGPLPNGRVMLALAFGPADQAESMDKIKESLSTLAPEGDAK